MIQGTDQPVVRVARQSMATRFEIALFGGDPASLRGAAEEALDEVERVERLLSWKMPTATTAKINARAALEPVRLPPELFDLIQRCFQLGGQTKGSFDITVGPLMHAWGFRSDDRSAPDEETIEQAMKQTGAGRVELDPVQRTIRFAEPGMRLDFGAIGKGWALDLAAEVLRDAGVESALIHGGTSTVLALGKPPNLPSWKIAVEYPPGEEEAESLPLLSVVELCDESFSVSAVWGRFFKVGSDTFGHVIDPRTGRPSNRAVMSAIACRSAADADALSTALLIDGKDGMGLVKSLVSEARSIVVEQNAGGAFEVHANGLEIQPG